MFIHDPPHSYSYHAGRQRIGRKVQICKLRHRTYVQGAALHSMPMLIGFIGFIALHSFLFPLFIVISNLSRDCRDCRALPHVLRRKVVWNPTFSCNPPHGMDQWIHQLLPSIPVYIHTYIHTCRYHNYLAYHQYIHIYSSMPTTSLTSWGGNKYIYTVVELMV
ncbi:uncharacterized protein GGS25DRAFT_180560 [Hypoxylon fragiforme]|uniref:uncharacterized protein n=1 Tax=Hypoxylon fragiforme TaxID=63214 RepID=UPI0020C5BD80|nr:uncharacterized protein GGS25DRAFT_180560 [Hypoxylon fragiforme]KAI2611070.1 hypothetical protein GGS25DRAFT_180560 [Hypoxylon fragiforme]